MDGIDPHFAALIDLLHASAFTALGKLVDPATGATQRDLQAARFYIDTLEMIEKKTAGNRSDEETRQLVAVLDLLRLNYLDESRRPEPSAAEPASPPPTES